MTRKELLAQYKNQKFRMGIFQIRNQVNGKILIESSMDLDKIGNRHRLQLNLGSYPNPTLQSDWNTFGEENFQFEILAELEKPSDNERENRNEIKLLEEMYIEDLQPFGEKGYHKEKV